MNKLKIVVLFLFAATQHLSAITPRGLLQSGYTAEYRKTKYDIFLVFTPQIEHEFEASSGMLKLETNGKIYWHIMCKHCKTYLVAGNAATHQST